MAGWSARSFAYHRVRTRTDLAVSDPDQLAVYIRRYLSCSRWRRVSVAIADRSAGPCGTAPHSWLSRWMMNSLGS
jgi:hypothetical protein